MKSFVDTNVSIAYMFSIDPLNNKSMSVFKEYERIFWSKMVKNECKQVFENKRKILVKFYKDLVNYLKPENFHNYSFNELKKYVFRNYSRSKKREQILSSLDKFWYNYVNERFPTYTSFVQAINNCLKDLKHLLYCRKEEWEKNTFLTEKRTEKYLDLKNKLKSLNVHSPDDEIVLDAHDFNLRNNIHLDFITFDKDCYEGVSKIKEFQFNKVKGKDDYL
ncbi:hypothetical protein PXD04_00630 [Methanosphaera sp. ISO3-F5]|uniref:hypothetical protein n=1 Tax=Methanosphaera sp. ISO3-F5 TaxID=1452353 RepID=UPI002B25DE90|nr:hypothetical protein [Methanosphaera sp. ISO3-F5]WQH64334.1 hypothetical protein PXD04_00630 [Methanosphaera sp. ISO3-F5]